jgi:hypothetical protein
VIDGEINDLIQDRERWLKGAITKKANYNADGDKRYKHKIRPTPKGEYSSISRHHLMSLATYGHKAIMGTF